MPINKRFRLLIIFCFLVVFINCSYYYNGTLNLTNSIRQVLWFNNSYVTYKSTDNLYYTQAFNSLKNNEMQLYKSPIEPKSQNTEFYFTQYLEKKAGIPIFFRVGYFQRNNLPACESDISQNNSGQVERILSAGAYVYLMQNHSKIQINKATYAEHSSQQIAKCKQTKFDSSTEENPYFDNKKIFFIQKNKQLAILYEDRIVLLAEQNEEFKVIQTIRLPQAIRSTENSSNKTYDIKYAFDENKEVIIVANGNIVLVYGKDQHQLEFVLDFTVNLQQKYVNSEIMYTEYILVLTGDCKVTKISLKDPKQVPVEIAYFPDSCNSSLLTPILALRSNNDLLFITAQHTQQNKSQSQLLIYIQPLPNQLQINQPSYKIPLKHNLISLNLKDYKYSKMTDFLYLVLENNSSTKHSTNNNSTKGQTLFLGFRMVMFKQQAVTELQWQWRSRLFISSEIQDYSISDDGVVVLQNRIGRQNLTWYKVGASYYNWLYPTLLVSRIKPVNVIEIVPDRMYQGYNFKRKEIFYSVYPSGNLHAISPDGYFVFNFMQDNKTLNLFTPVFNGTIDLIGYSENSSLVQFMSNNTIIQLNQQSNGSVTMYVYKFEFKYPNNEFIYGVSESYVVKGVNKQNIQWNLENIFYLNENNDKFSVLKLLKGQLAVQEEVEIQKNIIKNGLKLKLSTDKTVFLYTAGQKTVYQYVWCQEDKYLSYGECVKHQIGPDPNPFPLIQIILAICGVVAIFVVTYCAIKHHRARSRLVRLQNSLIESTTGQHDTLDIDHDNGE